MPDLFNAYREASGGAISRGLGAGISGLGESLANIANRRENARQFDINANLENRKFVEQQRQFNVIQQQVKDEKARTQFEKDADILANSGQHSAIRVWEAFQSTRANYNERAKKMGLETIPNLTFKQFNETWDTKKDTQKKIGALAKRKDISSQELMIEMSNLIGEAKYGTLGAFLNAQVKKTENTKPLESRLVELQKEGKLTPEQLLQATAPQVEAARVKGQYGVKKQELANVGTQAVQQLREQGDTERLTKKLLSEESIAGLQADVTKEGFQNKLAIAKLNNATVLEKAKVDARADYNKAKLQYLPKTLEEATTRDFVDGNISYRDALSRTADLYSNKPEIRTAQIKALSDMYIAKQLGKNAAEVEKIRTDRAIDIENMKQLEQIRELESLEKRTQIQADSRENATRIAGEYKVASEKAKAESAAIMNAAKGNLDKAKAAATIKTKFEADPRVKTFRIVDFKVRQAYDLLTRAAKLGKNLTSFNATDQAIINSFMKIVDETSVVRESEFDRAKEFASLIETAKIKIGQWRRGGTLSPLERTEFVNSMLVIRQIAKDAYKKSAIGYVDIAKIGGINPAIIVGEDAYNPEEDKGNQAAPISNQQNQTAPKTAEEYLKMIGNK